MQKYSKDLIICFLKNLLRRDSNPRHLEFDQTLSSLKNDFFLGGSEAFEAFHDKPVFTEKMKKIYGLLLRRFWWRHDTQRSDTQHNDTQHNDTQHNDTQHYDTQHDNIHL